MGKLNISTSPHTRSKVTTKSIMYQVAIALLPAAAFGVYQFGIRALLVILITVLTCMASEYLWQKLMHKPITVSDGSALVTGLLLALNLSADVPLWMPVIGGVFAIIVVKQLYGGLGQNFMNPALAARCFLLISFTKKMTVFTLDGISGPTPLVAIRDGKSVDIMDMFLGKIPGTIGEVSAIAILIGAIYLLIMKVISLRIPLIYIGSFAIFILLFGGHGFDMSYLASQVFGGGLMLGAFFMATDYATCPATPVGKIVYGVLLGVLTGIFRIFGASAEGVSYAIILSNVLVPLIERVTRPVAFGRERVRNAK